MLVYAAIVPHPPLAIDSIGKEKAKDFELTTDAMTKVGEDLSLLDVDTVLVISPFGERYNDVLGVAFHDPYIASLKEFGDMSTIVEYRPDMRLIDKIQRTVRRYGSLSTMTTNEHVDHGSAVPLVVLNRFIKSKKLVVITPPVTSPKTVVSFGGFVREAIDSIDNRVAVLCSADLSHRLSELSPGGVHRDAEKFDERIRVALSDGNSVALLKITDKQIAEQGAQGMDSIRLFWGLLGDTDYTMEELSYEYPFGIGHLVMVARLH